jgi:hypothetical protein
VAGELIQKQSGYNPVFIAGCAFSILAYVVLKILKTRTGILNEAGR